jgi:hypothetical protein
VDVRYHSIQVYQSINVIETCSCINTLYEIVFGCYLFILYFVVQHKGMHHFKIVCVHCAELKLLHNHFISDFVLLLTATLLLLHMRRFRFTAKRFIIANLVVHILLLHTGIYAWLTHFQEPLRYVQVFLSFVGKNSKQKLHVLETILTMWSIDVKEFILLHKMKNVHVMEFCALKSNFIF